MPEIDGYKTLDLVMRELGLGEPKVREAIKELGIQPTVFNADRRVKYYSPQDLQRIREWMRTH
jgi:hypothetical protein